MSVTVKNVTSIRWPIEDFCNQRWEVEDKDGKLISNKFALSTCPVIKFSLFYHDGPTWKECTYGVVLKNLGSEKSIELDLKIWFENKRRKRFGHYTGLYIFKGIEFLTLLILAHKQAFKQVGDQCKFNVNYTGRDSHLLKEIDDNHTTLFICCELNDLSLRTASVVNCDQEFYQNYWTLYEQEFHDAIIKVGDKEFKVNIFFFIIKLTFRC